MYNSRHVQVVVIGGVISEFICPSRMKYGLDIGWSRSLEMLMTQSTGFAWVPYVFAHLYYELHQFVYLNRCSLECGLILLQVWAYEHIAVTRPVCFRFREHD